MDSYSSMRSRITCAATCAAALAAAPVLGRLAWAFFVDVAERRPVSPDDAILGLLVVGGALASGYLAIGIMAELARRAIRHPPAPRPSGIWSRRPSTTPFARRLVAGAVGAGLTVATGLPARASDDWDPGWQPTDVVAVSDQVVPPPSAAARAPALDGRPVANPDLSTVVVQPGDSLWLIAGEHLDPGASVAQVSTAWPAWYAANRDVVGPDPDLIRPGQVLTQPASGEKEP